MVNVWCNVTIFFFISFHLSGYTDQQEHSSVVYRGIPQQLRWTHLPWNAHPGNLPDRSHHLGSFPLQNILTHQFTNSIPNMVQSSSITTANLGNFSMIPSWVLISEFYYYLLGSTAQQQQSSVVDKDITQQQRWTHLPTNAHPGYLLDQPHRFGLIKWIYL